MSSCKFVRRFITVADAEPIEGPYNHGVVIGHTLYMSGATGVDPKTDRIAGETIQEQARQALKNLGKVLNAAGATYSNVVKINVFLKDMNDFAAMNQVYTELFQDHYPARSTVQVAALPRNSKIEIEGVAIVGNIQDE